MSTTTLGRRFDVQPPSSWVVHWIEYTHLDTSSENSTSKSRCSDESSSQLLSRRCSTLMRRCSLLSFVECYIADLAVVVVVVAGTSTAAATADRLAVVFRWLFS